MASRLIAVVTILVVLAALVSGYGSVPREEELRGFADDQSGAAFSSTAMLFAAYRSLDELWASGVWWFRVRLFVNPSPFDGWGGFTGNNLSYTVALMLHIRSRFPSARFILDIHYSDTWAEPGRQEKPAVWRNLSYSQLLLAVYNYSFNVMRVLARSGAAPDIVQVGNEITCGFLWPDSDVCSGGWRGFIGLIDYAIRGIRDGAAPRLDSAAPT